MFWFASTLSYKEIGRGATVVDTTVQLPGADHPFGYISQGAIEEQDDEDAKRMVRECGPKKK